MSRRSLWLGYALVVCLVAGAAVALRSDEAGRLESPIPSIGNASAAGAKGLFTYLKESGADPGVLDTKFTTIPSDARVIVSLAPTRRFIGVDQWKLLREWVRRGNTFVYGVPRRTRSQYVETNLSLKWVFGPRPAPLLDTASLDDGLRGLLDKRSAQNDPNGADALPWLPSPLLAGVKRLRVAADEGLDTGISATRMIAGAESSPAILVFPDGAGEVVTLAGADLAENRRIAVADNLVFWLNLAARGRVYFDEYHHLELTSQSPGLFAAIGPTLLQLLLGALVLSLALGRRLGKARPLAAARRRSQGEYVTQLAQLYGAARLEAQLCEELQASLRRTLFERLGVSAALDDLEVARRLEQRTGVQADRYLALVRRARELSHAATRGEFALLCRDFALFEREIGC